MSASGYQFFKSDPNDVPPSDSVDQFRLFYNQVTNAWAFKNSIGTILPMGAAVQFAHLGVVNFAASPYAPVANETVSILTTGGDGADIIIDLPTPVGITGRQIKIVSATPPFTGALPGGFKIVVQTAVGLINGQASQELTNAGENLNLESDGTNWMIVG